MLSSSPSLPIVDLTALAVHTRRVTARSRTKSQVLPNPRAHRDFRVLGSLARCVLRAWAMRLSIPAFFVLGLAGACSPYKVSEPQGAVLHPFAPIPQEFARVCVIRTSQLAQAIAFPTKDNGALVGATKGPTFFCYRAEPGEHTLAIETEAPTSVELRAEGGKSYYLHQKVPFDPFALKMRCETAWVDETVARKLVDKSSYEVVTQGPNGEALPEPVPYAKAASR
jgi:hypothetical protein